MFLRVQLLKKSRKQDYIREVSQQVAFHGSRFILVTVLLIGELNEIVSLRSKTTFWIGFTARRHFWSCLLICSRPGDLFSDMQNVTCHTCRLKLQQGFNIFSYKSQSWKSSRASCPTICECCWRNSGGLKTVLRENLTI